MHNEKTVNIDIRAYIDRLLKNLAESHHLPHTAIRFDVKVDHIYVDASDAMIACQLINELVHNSLRYSFKGKTTGAITISLSQLTDHYRLIVADDGVGLRELCNPCSKASDGLQFAYFFVKQLRGRMTTIQLNGTRFEIEFPVEVA